MTSFMEFMRFIQSASQTGQITMYEMHRSTLQKVSISFCSIIIRGKNVNTLLIRLGLSVFETTLGLLRLKMQNLYHRRFQTFALEGASGDERQKYRAN